RRHTRFSRDWSSDVCSSDLRFAAPLAAPSFLALDPSRRTLVAVTEDAPGAVTAFLVSDAGQLTAASTAPSGGQSPCHVTVTGTRSEERRAGQGGGRWAMPLR